MLGPLKELAHGEGAAVPGSFPADLDCHSAGQRLNRAHEVAGGGHPVRLGEEIHGWEDGRRRVPRNGFAPPATDGCANRPDDDAEDEERRQCQPHPERNAQMEVADAEPAQEASQRGRDGIQDPLHDRWSRGEPDVAWHRQDVVQLLPSTIRVRRIDARLQRGVQVLQSLVGIGEIGRFQAQVMQNFRLARTRGGCQHLEGLPDRGGVAAFRELDQRQRPMDGVGVIIGLARRRGHAGRQREDERRQQRPPARERRVLTPEQGPGRFAGRVGPGRGPLCEPASRSRAG